MRSLLDWFRWPPPPPPLPPTAPDMIDIACGCKGHSRRGVRHRLVSKCCDQPHIDDVSPGLFVSDGRVVGTVLRPYVDTATGEEKVAEFTLMTTPVKFFRIGAVKYRCTGCGLRLTLMSHPETGCPHCHEPVVSVDPQT